MRGEKRSENREEKDRERGRGARSENGGEQRSKKKKNGRKSKWEKMQRVDNRARKKEQE